MIQAVGSPFVAALIQRSTVDQQAAQDAAAAAATGCMGCGAVFLGFAALWIVVTILLLVWVYKDAKSRGMDSPVLWLLVVAVLGVIGLIVYLLARPKGELTVCPHCQNKRPQVAATCPHCGKS